VLENAERLLIPSGQLLLDLADPASLMLPHDNGGPEPRRRFMLMEAWYDPLRACTKDNVPLFDRDGN